MCLDLEHRSQPLLARPITDRFLSIFVSDWPNQQRLTPACSRSLIDDFNDLKDYEFRGHEVVHLSQIEDIFHLCFELKIYELC